jgi:hypothetical protein
LTNEEKQRIDNALQNTECAVTLMREAVDGPDCRCREVGGKRKLKWVLKDRDAVSMYQTVVGIYHTTLVGISIELAMVKESPPAYMAAYSPDSESAIVADLKRRHLENPVSAVKIAPLAPEL